MPEQRSTLRLYPALFGKLDQQLKNYDTLYLAPDGFLNLLAFARLVTPDGQYWIQRQTLREVATGRHLIAGYDHDLDKPKGLLTLGGVDYESYAKIAPATPTDKPPQTDPSLTVACWCIMEIAPGPMVKPCKRRWSCRGRYARMRRIFADGEGGKSNGDFGSKVGRSRP